MREKFLRQLSLGPFIEILVQQNMIILDVADENMPGGQQKQTGGQNYE